MLGDQKVTRVFFLRGLYDPVGYPYHKEEKFLALKSVDGVAVSEVLAVCSAPPLPGMPEAPAGVTLMMPWLVA